MKQFYQTYSQDEIVPTLLTQLNWTSHMLIISRYKTKEKYTYRELERQIESLYYERMITSTYNYKSNSITKDIRNLKNFILEYGKDFTFIGEEYKIQVGKQYDINNESDV